MLTKSQNRVVNAKILQARLRARDRHNLLQGEYTVSGDWKWDGRYMVNLCVTLVCNSTGRVLERLKVAKVGPLGKIHQNS